MASINTRRTPKLPPQGGAAPRQFEPSNTMRTHEGSPASQIPIELQLRRSVCSCLLWEDTYYEGGVEISTRITDLARQVAPQMLADLAYDARSHFHLRHVPLLLCAVLAKTGAGSRLVSDTLEATIQRPDELSEFVSIYAKVNGVKPGAVRQKLSAQVKKGLAAAFRKFDHYQLAKYFSQSGEKDAAVRGRDVMFMAHPKAIGDEQNELFRRIAQKVAVKQGGADTWEVRLSAGPAEGVSREDHKRETFEDLLRTEKLGYLALLRNLRNMVEAKVDLSLIRNAIIARRGARRVLPFRYVAAARACPQMEEAIDIALKVAMEDMPPLPGTTIILVDVSGSMKDPLSGKSDLNRMDAASALAALIPGDKRVFSFSNEVIEVLKPDGLAGIRMIQQSQPHSGTYLGQAISLVQGSPHYSRMVNGQRVHGGFPHDRLVVITDEQSRDHVPEPVAKLAYVINVAPYKNGVGYGERYVHIDGFSEQTIRWIREFEKLS